MKTILTIPVLAFLLIAAPGRCLAMISVENVSTNRAKELGVTFRTNTNGEAGIRVWMEFKNAGELQKITYVEVRIGEGDRRIMSAYLPTSQPTPGVTVVSFSAFPAYLPESSLMIVVYNGPRGDVGYNFKLQDFIKPEKSP